MQDLQIGYDIYETRTIELKIKDRMMKVPMRRLKKAYGGSISLGAWDLDNEKFARSNDLGEFSIEAIDEYTEIAEQKAKEYNGL